VKLLGRAYAQLAYVIPQVLNTSFRLITSNQRSPKSGDFITSKSYGKVTRPFSATTKKNGKKRSGHARLWSNMVDIVQVLYVNITS